MQGDNLPNPFTNYDYYKGYDPQDDDYCPDDVADADDWGADADYLYARLMNK